jgi:hypothetical protein
MASISRCSAARSPASRRPTAPKSISPSRPSSSSEQQDVARMRVSVEDAVDDDLPQQAIEQGSGEPLAVAVGGCGLAQRLPVEPLHHQHAAGAEVMVGPRDHDPVRAGGRPVGGMDRREVPRLEPEVQFLAQRGGEALG